MSNLREQKIQLYLLRVTAYLFGMPRREKEEIRQEVRQHLEALIATHEYDGIPEEEAVDAALHQFGDPRKIGVEMARSWRKKQQNRIASERKAKEAVKPIGQRRRERAVRWLHTLVFGVGWFIFLSILDRPILAGFWIRLVLVAVAWGAVSGYVNAIQPSNDPGQELLQAMFQRQEDDREEKRDVDIRRVLQKVPLPKKATLHQWLSRCFLLGMSNWARRYRQRLLQEKTEHLIPRLDWRQIMMSVFWMCVVVAVEEMLPFNPINKRLCIALSIMLSTESISQLFWRRLIAQRRISQR